jgi:hypothetical protein
MFSRLFFLFRDEPVTTNKLILILLIQIVPLFLFELTFKFILLIIILIGLNTLFYYVENKKKKLNGFRFLSLIMLLIISAIFSSSFFNIEFNSSLIEYFRNIHVTFPFISNIENFSSIIIITSAVLFLLNEVNFLIRYFFEIFKLFPNPKEEDKDYMLDEREYNAGRVIGMLERILIFFFVFAGQYGAIGFIIAAKGFTRFKELDKREFAEYVLIGTLLSSLLAIVTALLVYSKIR